ncbi:MAG: Mth938-like domain-containing protein [Kiloniellales bacterium]
MDITPAIPAGRQIIESYGAGRFRVSGRLHQGSVLVFPQETLGWGLREISALSLQSLAPVIERANDVEVLLLGCGPHMTLVPDELRAALREAGIVVEPMDTGAACRTFNVLMAEERRVAAALIAVD